MLIKGCLVVIKVLPSSCGWLLGITREVLRHWLVVARVLK